MPREQYSVRHLLGELLGNLLQWDGKLLPTLTLALRKPGELSAHYMAGIKARYTSPVTLLLLVFFVFFLSPALTDFTLPLDNHLRWGQWYAGAAEPYLQQLAAERGGMAVIAERYGSLQADIAKTLVLLHVPLFAFGLYLLHWRRRFYYVEHLVVASHTVATIMLGVLLVCLLVLLPVDTFYHWHGQTEVPTSVKAIIMAVFLKWPLLLLLLLVLKNAYRQNWWLALSKLPLALLAFGFSHMLYRAVTFWLSVALL